VGSPRPIETALVPSGVAASAPAAKKDPTASVLAQLFSTEPVV